MTAIPRAIPSTTESGHRFDGHRRWAASLELGFDAHADGRTRLVRAHHRGPLRVQRSFYPEGRTGTCHVYLLHPPGGVVSGDALNIEVEVAAGAQALLTTPAANKLYRTDSHAVAWEQNARLRVADNALLEWLPQETIAFDGSRGRQTTTIELGSQARCLGWEVLALGRPASHLPFATGYLEQRFHMTREGRPLWRERQPLDPDHPRFLGHWGQGGATVQASLWAVGLDDPQDAIAALRDALPSSRRWAVTARNEVLLLRYLGDARNEAWSLCEAAWTVLRPRLAGREAQVPRIWKT
ncbi:urease accessory protein UreD [Halomonas caseinilytica]|uniref:Urease accessory protein UreD n=1 Tax=Halomonas caseinilytica TaxID=438744 RepID=A0A1M6U3J1_9GAMM|nr:urease accessory protein UreD [Halomonas caseinilytica]SEM93200.1 urease accessory protein [Halomonas caseinilytica]SHK63757.1 urease accessory protein [Halomonas caseinilytica]